MKKLLNIIVTLLVAAMFLGAGIGVSAQGFVSGNEVQVFCESPFSITGVEIEGVEQPIPETGSTVVQIEKGSSLNVRVELMATTGCSSNDVKVKTWIGGYEFSDIEDSTSLFDVTGGVTYVKNLVLNIPSDIDLSSTTNDHTLHIEAFNDDNSDELQYAVQVESQRHSLNFVDVIFNPGLSVKNTQPLFATVRLENLGEMKEDDIKVQVSIPELGMSQVTYINELVPVETTNNDNEETSQSSDTLLLDLSNVKAGTYNLVVSADYNRGHDTISQDYQLTVTGGSGTSTSNADLIVQASTASMDVNQGGSATYTFSVANLGSDSKTLTFEVTGQEAWATANVQPIAVTVLPDSTREVMVNVNAKSDADLGSKVFVVRVKDGSNVVKELQLTANIKSTTSDNLTGLRSGLEIGFIVLLVILVILGIILAISKLSKGKEESGESYY